MILFVDSRTNRTVVTCLRYFRHSHRRLAFGETGPVSEPIQASMLKPGSTETHKYTSCPHTFHKFTHTVSRAYTPGVSGFRKFKYWIKEGSVYLNWWHKDKNKNLNVKNKVGFTTMSKWSATGKESFKQKLHSVSVVQLVYWGVASHAVL